MKRPIIVIFLFNILLCVESRSNLTLGANGVVTYFPQIEKELLFDYGDDNYFKHKNQPNPTLVLCQYQAYDFHRTDWFKPLRVVKDSDCPDCKNGAWTGTNAPTSSLTWSDVTILYPYSYTFTETGVYWYVGTCSSCQQQVGKIEVISCPCYNGDDIPSPGDCNDMCPSERGYQYNEFTSTEGTVLLHGAVNYFGATTCKECSIAGTVPNCDGHCTTDGNFDPTTVYPDCNNRCPGTPGYEGNEYKCEAENPTVGDRPCANDCNGLCWFNDGWKPGPECVIRWHNGFMFMDPLLYTKASWGYDVPPLTEVQTWCPPNEFIIFKKNNLDHTQISYNCEPCLKDNFLVHYNRIDTTRGQEHGKCCVNPHHKMCQHMMMHYKLKCEEMEKGVPAQCHNNIFNIEVDGGYTNYIINGIDEPILTLQVGITYTFRRIASAYTPASGHAFRIVAESDCVEVCTRSLDSTAQQPYFDKYTYLPKSSVTTDGGNFMGDAVVGKDMTWDPIEVGIYYYVSVGSQNMMGVIKVVDKVN